MKYKLIAIDLDGTLLNSSNSITPYTIEIIKQLDRMGVIIVIATGRSYSSLRHKITELELKQPVICYNGAMIRDGATHDIVFNSSIPPDISKELVNISRSQNIHLHGFVDGEFLYEKDSESSQYYRELSGLDGLKINFDTMEELNFTKGMFIGDHTILKKLEKQLKLDYNESLYISFSKPIFLEIMNSSASKSNALIKVCKKLNIDSSEVLAFGDGLNDADMLAYAGKGVVMKNGHSELVSKFENTKYSNDEDGVAKYLKALING